MPWLDELTPGRCLGGAVVAVIDNNFSSVICVMLFYGCPFCKEESQNNVDNIPCSNNEVEVPLKESKGSCYKTAADNIKLPIIPMPVGFIDSTSVLHSQKLFQEWVPVPHHEYIHKLQIDDLNRFLEKEPLVLIMFYASWCQHSEDSKVAFAQAAYTLIEENIGGSLAAINCEINEKVCISSRISGYPTFNVYRKGAFIEEYTKSRDADDFVKLMKKHSVILRRKLFIL